MEADGLAIAAPEDRTPENTSRERAAPGDLHLRGVSRRYGNAHAADNVCLTIPGGKFFSLLGPSGSGKTTLLMIIAGFVTPEAGVVTLGDRDLTAVPPERRNFGMVFQGYALFPNLTVAGNIAFPLAVRRLPRAEQQARVRAALDMVQLGDLADRLPRQLSGGQQQRVALARALVFDPEILLLDEPLSALDKKLRAGLQIELRALQRRVGKTFICVTHDQEEALSMSDEIAIVRQGRIVQHGRPRELFERPASYFVADFLGESNFLTGRMAHRDTAGRLHYRIGDAAFVHAGGPQNCASPAPTETILLALRPFRVSLSAMEPHALANRVRGTLLGATYRGAEAFCTVDTPIGRLSVSLPSWGDGLAPTEGQAIWLGWTPDASVMVIDDR